MSHTTWKELWYPSNSQTILCSDIDMSWMNYNSFVVAIVQSLSQVWLLVTPWTAAHQASLSFIISCSLLKLMSIESVIPPKHLILCCPLLLLPSIFPSIRIFPKNWLFASGNQSTGASASGSSLPMSIQSWFPLRLTTLISLLSKRLSRVFSSTVVQKHQFFSAQPSLWSNFHIHTWLLEKTQLWLYGPLSAKGCLCFLICYLGLLWLFFPRSKRFFSSMAAVTICSDFGAQKNKACHSFHCFPIYLPAWDQMLWS